MSGSCGRVRALFDGRAQFPREAAHHGVKDPFGNQWWIATHFEDVSAEEAARRQAEGR